MVKFCDQTVFIYMKLISLAYSKMQHSCSHQDAVRFETPTSVTLL